jgi:hypothetical protein
MVVEIADHLTMCFVVVRRFPSGVGEISSRSLRSTTTLILSRMKEFVSRSTSVPFRRLFGDMRWEVLQYLFMVLKVTLGSYLWDAL